MPTYEYACEKCGERTERFQAMSAAHLERCPKCGGKVRQVFGGGVGVIVKGSRESRLPCGLDSPCHGGDSPCAKGYCDG